MMLSLAFEEAKEYSTICVIAIGLVMIPQESDKA